MFIEVTDCFPIVNFFTYGQEINYYYKKPLFYQIDYSLI